MSFGQAVEAGFDPSFYEGTDVPEGAWTGRLDFKVWTKRGAGLSCYFTRVDGAGDGAAGGAAEGGGGGAPERYRLAAFRLHEEGGVSKRYTARDGAVDFSADDEAAPGDVFVLTVGRARTGNVRWASAEPVVGGPS